MTGDASDILARLKAVLPFRWFADKAPILDGMLSGLAGGWARIYSFLLYTKAQTRVMTATDVWLDIVAKDFFGLRLCRRVNETDIGFSQRLQRSFRREHGTRGAITAALTDLTGHAPAIFEPARTTDTGGYGSLTTPATGIAWGVAGCWGNLNLPFQCFVTAFRPTGSGIASVTGWGGGLSGSGIGAYGTGAIEYATLAMLQGQVSDQDIYQTVADMMPVAAIGWIQISN